MIAWLALVGSLGACVDEPGLPDEAPPLEDDGPPSADELADGKADWFGDSAQAWRRYWYASHYYQLKAPIEAGMARAPFSGPRTVLLIPGTTIGPEFFEPMAARLRRDGFDPVIWAPPDLFTESLELGAARIYDKVKSVLEARGESRLHIVAECDGGVAARFYGEYWGGTYHVDQMVTFVSAHHGSSVAPVGSATTGWQALRDIKPNSPFMNRLNGIALPATGMNLTSIYSCHDEFMFPYTTSWVPNATNVEFCRQPIGHFDGFWDRDVYERILVTLRGEGADAPVSY